MRHPLVQLALDLWGDAAAEGQGLPPNRPPAPASQAPAATKKRADVPAPVPVPGAPAVLQHPQANRQIRLEGAQVAYLLQRARRRSIGFRVDGDGLSVRAPMAASSSSIESALQAKSGWIVRKLADQADYQRRLEGTRIAWGDGAVLPYLGAPLTVVLDPTLRKASRGAQLAQGGGEGGDGSRAGATLYVPLAGDARPEQIRDTVQAWLMRDARRHFTQRLEHFAPQLGVRWTRLALSSARSRWGSARIDGSIRLNWRLMHYSHEVIDYVVVHELSHLRVMDHSPRFWSTVESVMPDWAALRRHLRDQPAPPWG